MRYIERHSVRCDLFDKSHKLCTDFFPVWYYSCTFVYLVVDILICQLLGAYVQFVLVLMRLEMTRLQQRFLINLYL